MTYHALRVHASARAWFLRWHAFNASFILHGIHRAKKFEAWQEFERLHPFPFSEFLELMPEAARDAGVPCPETLEQAKELFEQQVLENSDWRQSGPVYRLGGSSWGVLRNVLRALP